MKKHNYWLDLFTGKTWQEFKAAGSRISGFRESRWSTVQNLIDNFPTIAEGLPKAQTVFCSIKSFEDIERIFLRGQGLSYNTYRSYLTAVRQFYEFTDGLNPLQVTPAWIEMFYDHLIQKVDISTAHLRICGLKKFLAGIRRVVPFYSSPFEIMSASLNRKLNRSKGRYRTKQALTKTELKTLLAWLYQDKSIKGLENYAIVLMLVTSGLRASELCQLSWESLYREDGRIIASFVGKGGKSAEQELYLSAVEATDTYFKAQFRRTPEPCDWFYYTLENYSGRLPSPLTPPRYGLVSTN